MCSLHAGPAYYTLLLTVYIFFSKNEVSFSFARSLETSFPTPGAASYIKTFMVYISYYENMKIVYLKQLKHSYLIIA